MENGAVCLLKVHRRHGHCHDRTARTVKEAEQNLALRILLAQAALHPFNDREMWLIIPHVLRCGAPRSRRCTRRHPYCFAELCNLDMPALIHAIAKCTQSFLRRIPREYKMHVLTFCQAPSRQSSRRAASAAGVALLQYSTALGIELDC